MTVRDTQACDVPAVGGATSDLTLDELPASAVTVDVIRYRDGLCAAVQDDVASEVPVALVFNGISHVVMLASPADLEDFAYGFAWTEGIITQPAQFYGVELVPVPMPETGAGIEVRVELASEAFAQLKSRRRNLAGRTGCGLCGAESLQQVFKHPTDVAGTFLQIALSAIQQALQEMLSHQHLQQQTGASHACALVDMQGKVIQVREDVGRHNALDKLMGALMRERQSIGWSERWVLTTSRASYEMVQKVAMAGGRALVAMSAPTELAIALAKQYRMTLVGFARSGQCVVYAGEVI